MGSRSLRGHSPGAVGMCSEWEPGSCSSFFMATHKRTEPGPGCLREKSPFHSCVVPSSALSLGPFGWIVLNCSAIQCLDVDFVAVHFLPYLRNFCIPQGHEDVSCVVFWMSYSAFTFGSEMSPPTLPTSLLAASVVSQVTMPGQVCFCSCSNPLVSLSVLS